MIAPRILFTYRVWGSTRLSSRRVEISADTIDEEHEMVRVCTEAALGLRTRLVTKLRYTVQVVYWDIYSDIAESIDPEYQSSISVPKETLLFRASHKILGEFAAYFEFLRQSLRNIILEIKRYHAQTELLYIENLFGDPL